MAERDDDGRLTEDGFWLTYVPEWPELEEIFMAKLDMTPEEFRELVDEAKLWAFSVAKIETATVLARAKEKLGSILLAGGDIEDFLDWAETSGMQWSTAYTTLVARMAVLPTHGLARYQEMHTKESIEDFDYLMYDAINDNRVRPEHLAMDNRVWRRDQFPSEWWPPNGYNCNHGGNRVSVDLIEAVFRRPYSGPILSLETAGGRGVLVTPNHPVATDSGFLPAHELEVGAKLVVDSLPGESSCGCSEGHENDLPPSFHEVFSASLEVAGLGSRSRESLSPGLDFHGDVFIGQSEVDVVRPSMPLSLGDLSEAIQNLRDLGLSGPDCLVSCPRPASEPLGYHLVPVGAAHRGSGLERWSDHGSALLEAHFRAALAVRGVDFLEIVPVAPEGGGFRGISQLNSSESGIDPASGSSEAFRDAEYRLPAEVELDDLVSVRVLWLDGHVYNLQSSTHTYYSNSILTGNCRCSVRQLNDFLLRRSGGVLQTEGGAPLVDGAQLQPDKGFRANQMAAYLEFLQNKQKEAEDRLNA